MTDLSVDIANAQPLSAEWWLGRLTRRLANRQVDMALMDDYYHGKHRETFKVRDVLKAFGLRQPLVTNYCAVVVDSLNERLGVDGFRFGSDDTASTEAWTIWQENNLDAGFKRGMRTGLVKSEFSLLVWPDPKTGEPRIHVEDGAQVIVATDPADRRKRRAALKRWYDEDARRSFATVYTPDGIFKFQLPAGNSADQAQLGELPEGFRMGGGAGSVLPAGATESSMPWERRVVDGEDWPIVNQWGEVPVFSIPNKPNLAGVGESEIALVVPIQDAINANIANVMLAGLYGAFRQKYATNVELEVDDKTGKPKMPWDVSMDRLMTAPPPDDGKLETKFGEFGQSELKGYIELHEAFVQGIATITRIPAHYLLGSQGTFPSGEALTAVERGLSEKARERGTDTADPVEEAMRFAFRIKSVQSGLSSAKVARFIKWAAMVDAEVKLRDPETRSESQHVDALTKLMGLKVPIAAIWAKLPASPQEVLQWTAELEKAQKEEAARLAAMPPVVVPPPAPPSNNGNQPPAPAPVGAPPDGSAR